MTTTTLPQIAVVDVETTGLDEDKNVILELGIVLYGIDLNEIASFSQTVTDSTAISHLDHLAMLAAQAGDHLGQEPWSGAEYVHRMHQDNGLAWEIREANATGQRRTHAQVADEAAAWMMSQGLGPGRRMLPMTGSSVLLDRSFIKRQMPALNEMFHYRNTDVSTLKNLTEIYRADVAESLLAVNMEFLGTHRVLADCRNTARELQHYLTTMWAKR